MNKKSPFRVEIMAIGSELLTPYRQDTNSLYLTERLNELGYDVSFKTVVGDDLEDLVVRIKDALAQADIILAIGGLGPTTDDRTREAFAHVLKKELVLDREILRRIKDRFRRRRIPMAAANRKQALLIRGAEPIPNKNGTAPGQWLEAGRKKIVLLPGPPHELKPMFETSVLPLFEKERRGYLVRKVLKTTGLTESKIETMISDLYPQTGNLRVTVLAYPGQIELHLTSFSSTSRVEAERKLFKLKDSICRRLGVQVFSESGEELEDIVGKLLRQQRRTLAVAESCSGGLLSHRLTNIPGSSEYFLEGTVAYSNTAKTDLLGVAPALIERQGAVSSPVARAMALGICKRAKADYGLAITGIAGPAGGSAEKPIGLVFTALAWRGGTEVQKNLFLGGRELIKFQSTQKALDMLRRRLVSSVQGGKRGLK